MSEIEDFYNQELARLRKSCSVFDTMSGSCRGRRCVCSAIAECLSYQKKVLPSGFFNYNFSDFNGMVNGDKALEDHDVKAVLSKVLHYCFSDSNINLDSSRYDLHKKSFMDRRFEEGHNVIIYGDGISPNKKKLGKTMIASLIMKEAIWRRIFASNKAYTYLFKSCPEIIDDIISKRYLDHSVNALNADWLCIDDVFMKNRPGQSSVLDQIMSFRLGKNLPTIIVIQFDVFKIGSSEDILGNHVVKMLSDKDSTFVISLS